MVLFLILSIVCKCFFIIKSELIKFEISISIIMYVLLWMYMIV